MATTTTHPKKGPGRPRIPWDPRINRAIATRLEETGVSEKELARRIRIAQSNVNRWVQAAWEDPGKSVGPALHQLHVIEDALGDPRGTLYALAYGSEVELHDDSDATKNARELQIQLNRAESQLKETKSLLDEKRRDLKEAQAKLQEREKLSIIDFGELLYSTISTINAAIGGNLSASLAESIVDLIRKDDALEPHYMSMAIEAYNICRDTSLMLRTKTATKTEEQLPFATKPSVGAALKHAS